MQWLMATKKTTSNFGYDYLKKIISILDKLSLRKEFKFGIEECREKQEGWNSRCTRYTQQ
jgi:hypothetical protein